MIKPLFSPGFYVSGNYFACELRQLHGRRSKQDVKVRSIMGALIWSTAWRGLATVY